MHIISISVVQAFNLSTYWDLEAGSQARMSSEQVQVGKLARMIWKLVFSIFLVAAFIRVTETRKNRPAGAIPSPYKDSSTNNSERRQHLNKEVLASSQEALVVTERKYLKSDWCKTQPLRQTVSEEGCISRTIINRFCYGQCNSFYIPRHVKKEEESFQSCAFCKPQKVTSFTVELECPDMDPPFRLKKIQKVKSERL
uniref:Gremlin 2, DAN family BMP antagonist n=1 Tax=Crocodylus porosus TaxID=8502 RepID=A0A7M4F982_CROPO